MSSCRTPACVLLTAALRTTVQSVVVMSSLFVFMLLSVPSSIAQQTPRAAEDAPPEAVSALIQQPGVIITLVLITIPLMLMLGLALSRINNRFLASRLAALPDESADDTANGIPAQSATASAITNVRHSHTVRFVAMKKKAIKRPNIAPELARLIVFYLVSATVWLLWGTTVGEYIGLKFVLPDIDHVSWLSFGRLRPVHTNAVFWGWASLGMLGLGYYIVPMVSNAPIASLRRGWWSLWLINLSVLLGTICLMAGVNNGGGEYREYIWPVVVPFGVGLVLTLVNFIQTIARRTTEEIYISNWYIVSAIIFALVITIIAYVPTWQNGLGESIVQGYYMHQGVGMWFMMFSLGIVYYFLPQQLNKPIYSYGLGVVAFWSQIVFYTLIGTHHFVLSSIPWWLQTVAIVGSAGMLIPVAAGTTNFLMTFRGSWQAVGSSYTLPFYLVGVVFYCTGSMQGTAEAFRSTNLMWHFTDFTVAHSHIAMYGIISFLLWASIYAVLPRLTGHEPPQAIVGGHFWLAFAGLMFYTIPLMIGGTLKGLMWMDGKPFIDSVVIMGEYWLWRAIGGSLMWLSHCLFAFNVYKMLRGKSAKELRIEADTAIVSVFSKQDVVQNTEATA
jgi:cytochrome c oxidase cbb3-type subunit I